MRFEVHPVNPQARIVKLAAAALEDDGLVLYPTESGYAIGCNAESPKAIHKLYALKKPMKKFFMALIIPDIRKATDYARVDNFAFNIMKPRVPGPYTFILPADPHIARRLDVKRPEIGVRMPTHPFFKELFQHSDKPILSTAAKLTDEDEDLRTFRRHDGRLRPHRNKPDQHHQFDRRPDRSPSWRLTRPLNREARVRAGSLFFTDVIPDLIGNFFKP